MTRGTMVLFTEDKVYCTSEWNGDMYLKGYGEIAFNMLRDRDVTDVITLHNAAKMFNRSAHRYPEEKIKVHDLTRRYTYNDLLDMTYNYIEKYFSDYLFIKNVSGRKLKFKLDGGNYCLDNGDTGVVHFGELAKDFEENGFRISRGKPDIEEFLADHPDITLSDDEKSEINYLLAKSEDEIVAVFNNRSEYARETALNCLEDNKWVIPYFDFSAFEKDLHLPENTFELNSGKIVVLES